jgi:NNP family nitrate/nitrite transporter-like MFS transporter
MLQSRRRSARDREKFTMQRPMTVSEPAPEGRGMALGMSTLAFTVCFAVWTIFSIIGIQIKKDLGLSDTQFGLLVGTPILTGSLIRLLLGVWTDQHGGRVVYVVVMLAAAIATWLLTFATDYLTFLLAALGVGIAGGSFAVGIAYVSRWYDKERQGTALGIFGAGNVGASVTKFVAPFVMVAYGWKTVADVWAIALVITAIVFWFTTRDDPELAARRRSGAKPASMATMLEPLRNVQVWRFALYYFFVFGGYVALSLWLPRYLIGVYGLSITSAGMLAAAYSIPASLFRIYGGVLSDKHGARRVMYWTFGVSVLACFVLSYPPTQYVVKGITGPISFTLEMGLVPFVAVIFVLGFFMSLGKAAVYKHIPIYYPNHVGAVGGVVGLVGGLGGFVLPIAFGVMNDLTGIWTSCFALLFLVAAASLAWMHFAIRAMEREAVGEELAKLPELPEMQEIHRPEHVGKLSGQTLEDWRPEDKTFWEQTGRKIARRNLAISIPALLLSFAVWMVWSVVVAKLPAIGFTYTTDQLFWLAALPGVSGATLRIFYSFTVPIFGGRLWTTLATWSLMIPAVGIGYAVQNPATPYWIFLVLALLCGFGGGNFASSMSNISFLFGWLGGEPQVAKDAAAGGKLWLQNAGFIWVPFIVVSAFAAWFGMNDIASAKASFAEQSVIFQRRHNWIMCWLYTGTFGSFIGYSAGFPLLAKTQFPEINALQYAFLGPLVGALSRSLTGWIADRWGGGRVTFWVFVVMALGALGVVHFLGDKNFAGFFAMFLVLFLASGVGNASTFQMIPAIMRKDMDRLMPGASPDARRMQSDKESAAIIGFTSAIAAFGAFFIPKSFGSSIAMTGSAAFALYGFLVFYLTCIAITWFFYTGRGGLLFDIERSRLAAPVPVAGPAQ